MIVAAGRFAMRGDHSFGEIRGRLDVSFEPPADLHDKVVLSSISHGEHECTQAPGVGIKYVARGTEYYSFDRISLKRNANLSDNCHGSDHWS